MEYIIQVIYIVICVASSIYLNHNAREWLAGIHIRLQGGFGLSNNTNVLNAELVLLKASPPVMGVHIGMLSILSLLSVLVLGWFIYINQSVLSWQEVWTIRVWAENAYAGFLSGLLYAILKQSIACIMAFNLLKGRISVEVSELETKLFNLNPPLED